MSGKQSSGFSLIEVLAALVVFFQCSGGNGGVEAGGL